MKISDLLKLVSDLKNQGVNVIDVAKFEELLQQTQATETNHAEWNLKVTELKHQSKLAEYGATQEMSRRLLDAAISFAAATLKSALLINGGAAVAILAYLGNRHTEESGIFPASLAFFTGGVLFAAIAAGFSYITQICYAEAGFSKWGNRFRLVAGGFIVAAYCAFALGSYTAYVGFN
ncbi:MAG TPA: hypothetical protein PLF88_04650 [Opitutaceae bacterium]|nr:hypothetical protein [Opitutaceae bacterium]HRJ48250.1 hypothetical protein [Opitutaceae bacterium]